MKAFSKYVVLGSLAGALLVSGCASSAEADPATAAQAADQTAPPEVAHMAMVREALGKLSLRADQRATVDQLGREADARHEPIRQARVALRSTLADQVAAGKIDRAALKPLIDNLTATIESSRAADRVALGRLHDILDPSQRNQFVDSLESQMHARHDHQGGREHMKRWAEDLKLTDQQKDQIRTAMRARFDGQQHARGEFHAMREQGKQLLESFRQDTFAPDPNTAVFSRDHVEHGVGKMIDLAETALPMLTPDQRAIAAAKIRSGGGHF